MRRSAYEKDLCDFTGVFDVDELFAIYDSLMLMCKIGRENFKFFATEHPKSAKIKTKGNWAKKYYACCFAFKKERGIDVITVIHRKTLLHRILLALYHVFLVFVYGKNTFK